MSGNVSGLPTMVPNSDAMMLPRTSQAKAAATRKCRPKKGVNDARAPQAKPSAMRCGLSGSRRIRLLI